jgi:recombination protein RecA
MEGTYTRAWGEHCGIDNDGLLYYSASSMNEAIDVIEVLLRSPEVCLVVLDSMSIIGSDQENEKSMEDDQMATNARLWNKAARKLRSAMNSNKDATLIAINATSTKLGGYGDPEETKNGLQWKLFKSVSVRMNALTVIKGKLDGTTEVSLGRNISLMNKKQKFGTPFRTAEMYFSFVDDGVIGAGETDIISQLVELGLKIGVIERSAQTYTFDTAKAVGTDKFKNLFRDSAALTRKLRDAVYSEITQ